ncbi:PTS sugar transporter subunit IIA [Candidatus Dependentiae bacterium]|nr:PTS sugar transporter subunit IIA [Candidatus Dependentiae bacterium]
MKISDCLVKKGIEVDFKATGKSSAIRRLCKILADSSRVIDYKKMMKDIFIREDIESTGIGEFIALPHARTDAVSKPLIAIAISKKGIEFDSLDSRPVKIIFMIVVPIKQSKQLLKLLAKVTQFLKKPNTKQELLAAESPGEIIKILKKE